LAVKRTRTVWYLAGVVVTYCIRAHGATNAPLLWHRPTRGGARRRSPRGAAPVGTLARFQPSTTPPPRGALILLSAALIVRDEGAFLDGCLASLRGLVDEIVVVATGSVDDTVAVAHAHRAVVDEIDWCDDFSAARNHSLDLASGEWVLHVDAD
jgi:hypothetical protein